MSSEILRDSVRAWLKRLPEGLSERREPAAARVLERGLPTRGEEAWRFTPIELLTAVGFEPPPPGVAPGPVPAGPPPVSGELRATVVDGHFVQCPASLPDGLSILSHARGGTLGAEYLGRVAERALEAPRAFLDLNTALFQDAVLLVVREGTVVERPIHLVLGTAARPVPVVAHPRVLVVVEPRAQLTLVETYFGGDGVPHFCNAVSEVVVGDGAVLRHVRVQQEGEAGFHVATLAAEVGRDASYRSHVVSFGGRMARLDVDVVLSAPGADVELDGLYVAAHAQHLDHHTFVDHRQPNGTSRQLYKGILDGTARTVFDGRVAVRRGAQKTSAHQENRNLLLSAEALAYTKPSLNIDADDVRCSHGATVGQLDEEPLFYLRSRGIDERTARSILTYAFGREVLDRLPVDDLRRRLAPAAVSRLAFGTHLGEFT